MNPYQWCKRLFVNTQYKRVVRDSCNVYRECINNVENTLLEPSIQKKVLDILESNQEPLRIIVGELKKLQLDQLPSLGKIVDSHLNSKMFKEKVATFENSIEALNKELKAEE